MDDAALTAEIDVALRDMRIFRWVRSCLSKTQYSSEERAREISQRRRKFRGVQLYVYACPHCCGWHVTAKPQ
jgi:hypothetical protein